MKTITLFAYGSDGSPHGHGDCDFGDFDIEVNEEQYAKIKEYVQNGEEDPFSMQIEGISVQCNAIVDEILSFYSNPEDYSVLLRVSLDDDEEDFS